MNLKEAFRFQNTLQSLMSEAELVLRRESNVTKVKTTYLRKKVCAEAEDETVEEVPTTDYADQITEMTEFMVYLLGEREKLFAAIREAKNDLPLDIDSQVSLNAGRQTTVRLLKRMADLRPSEVTIPCGGVGYRFNADGNQVEYKCDARKVTTINFDRNAVRKLAAELARRADEVSAEVDRCVVNAKVTYEPPFDVNDSFADVFESFATKKSA